MLKNLSTINTTKKHMATNNTTGKNDWDKKELGAFWKKKSQTTGESYLTGTLNLKNLGDEFPDKDVPVIVFSNKSKKKDTHPDLRVYLSEKRDAPAKVAAKVAAPVPASADPNELI